MRDDSWAPYGAAAGAVAIVLFAIGSLLTGDRPSFDAPGAEVAADLDEKRTRIQLGSAVLAALAPFFVWFLATVASLVHARGPRTRRASVIAFGCGLAFIAVFLIDVTSLAVSALRPENLAATPELAVALRDFEFLAMGVAAFLLCGMLAAFAVLRDKALWPQWLGWLAMIAALAYALRIGTLFTTEACSQPTACWACGFRSSAPRGGFCSPARYLRSGSTGPRSQESCSVPAPVDVASLT